MDLASGEGVTHAWFTGPVLFPFGWGLSYTTFAYAWQPPGRRLGDEQGGENAAGAGAVVTLRATATNTGPVAGDCVVLAFKLRSTSSTSSTSSTNGQSHESLESHDEPLRKLVGFKRLRALAPGETRAVAFAVTAALLGLETPRKARRVTFEVGDVVAPARAVFEV